MNNFGIFMTLTKRNIKLFFKDKGMVFTSLITPLILLVLYVTFLRNVYEESFQSMLNNFEISIDLINASVASQLVSSLLAVSCVTVAFCSNLLMVNDKLNNVLVDFKVTPVKKPIISLAYFFGTLLITLIIAYITLAIGLVYIAFSKWYLGFSDICLLILDTFLVTTFGTALSTLINSFIKTNGQAQAVGTIVSAGYGFICGAYMPIGSFSTTLKNIIMCLPGTYGTSLIRNHFMGCVFEEMEQSIPAEVVEGIKSGIDCNIEFFGNSVSILTMYLVMFSTTLLLIALFILINKMRKEVK